MTAPLARLMDVTKSFAGLERPALDSITATINAGRLTGIVGPDGAGKTTMIRLLTGLVQPDSGAVEVLGADAKTNPGAVQAAIGYMPQRFGLYEDLSVQENLDLYADLQGLSETERQASFDRLLDFTDLKPFRERLAGKLSGGMKQKLGLACALLRRPRLLLLDEPSVGVDPVSRRELWAMVRALVDPETAIVWSTSYLDEAERCDETLLLTHGQLLYTGPPAGLTERVRGRIFRLHPAAAEKRSVLQALESDPAIADAVLQGDSIRVMTRPDASPQTRVLQGASPAAPRFEDAFVDRLGGSHAGPSPLGEAMRTIAASDAPVIEARGLTKRFGDFVAAQDITFQVRPGEVFGLLGPNGAGKSTTFKMLCGLLTPSGGEGHVAGFDLRRAAPMARSRLGYMAQKFSLYSELSVRQNLEFFAGIYGLKGAHRRSRIDTMLDVFELGALAHRNAGTLSLGFKQRLALASALLHEPEALFLDEPTSGVDPLARREFWSHINALVKKNVAVLVTTHFMEEAEYCDRISLIYRARLVAEGSPDALKAQVRGADLPDPTMEDAFIRLIERNDAQRDAA
ncbi:MAG: ABC transporter ATP-binding protein [Hyphomonadaceae bacterium]|nr:MAG: ABC-2 type transport system ATP-binding protein [Caulobacteraceae bacterium]MBT9445818.1 ABC transporter ATP-binding protein [Hyphomonadaceae bacterium]